MLREINFLERGCSWKVLRKFRLRAGLQTRRRNNEKQVSIATPSQACIFRVLTWIPQFVRFCFFSRKMEVHEFFKNFIRAHLDPKWVGTDRKQSNELWQHLQVDKKPLLNQNKQYQILHNFHNYSHFLMETGRGYMDQNSTSQADIADLQQALVYLTRVSKELAY